ANASGMTWLGFVLPLLFLLAGLVLAFLATGLRFKPTARLVMNVPAFFFVAADATRKLPWPKPKARAAREQIEPSFAEDDDDEDYDDEDDDEDDEEEDGEDGDGTPPTRHRAKGAIRVKREERRIQPVA